jgi:hypothetical protein
MLIPINKNELAFQLWWFAYYDQGCACVLHTFSLDLESTMSYSMSSGTVICGGERHSVLEMQRR